MKIDDLGNEFGAMVRAARENRQWTQADLARHLGALLGKEVNALVVTRIETGKRPVPLPEVAALAQLLHLELDPLLNPSPVRMSRAELVQRRAEVQREIDELHQEEVRLMAAYASSVQQLERTRTRRDALQRELQAVDRDVKKDGDHGKQEHQEEAER
ncbi:multiprotein-bridging factor 1 family protein [Streptomyces sp. NPDC050516]|uniref:multiprotein-bridging factor 1 family protein n=1 Tax=Streptomyces sp. NPDC050516 TaxID=3365621 RepID=UPI003790E59C